MAFFMGANGKIPISQAQENTERLIESISKLEKPSLLGGNTDESPAQRIWLQGQQKTASGMPIASLSKHGPFLNSSA